MIKRFWPVLLVCAIHIVVLMVYHYVRADIWEGDYSFSVFYGYADKMMDGRIPYKDFDSEYSPVALLLMLVPRLLTASEANYQTIFAIQMLLFDLIGLLLVADLAGRLGRSSLVAALVYTASLVTIGPIIIERFDLAPAVMVLFSLYAFLRGWHSAAWVVLGIAFLTKLYPIVIAPLFVLYLFRRGEYWRIGKGSLILLVTVAIIVIPFLCLDMGAFLHSYSYHTERGLQIESSYASVLLLGDDLGLTRIDQVFNHAAWHLEGSPSDTIADFSFLIAVVVLSAIYYLYHRGDRFVDSTLEPGGNSRLLNYSLITLAGFLLTSKIFSPQFIIWLYPLVPLISGPWRFVSWAVFFLASGLTYYIYPEHYGELLVRQSKLVYTLVARNCLILPFGLSLIQLQRNSRVARVIVP